MTALAFFLSSCSDSRILIDEAIQPLNDQTMDNSCMLNGLGKFVLSLGLADFTIYKICHVSM